MQFSPKFIFPNFDLPAVISLARYSCVFVLGLDIWYSNPPPTHNFPLPPLKLPKSHCRAPLKLRSIKSHPLLHDSFINLHTSQPRSSNSIRRHHHTSFGAVLFYKAAFGAEEVNRVMYPKRKAEQELPLLRSAELKVGSSSILVSDFTDDSSAP